MTDKPREFWIADTDRYKIDGVDICCHESKEEFDEIGYEGKAIHVIEAKPVLDKIARLEELKLAYEDIYSKYTNYLNSGDLKERDSLKAQVEELKKEIQSNDAFWKEQINAFKLQIKLNDEQVESKLKAKDVQLELAAKALELYSGLVAPDTYNNWAADNAIEQIQKMRGGE